MCFYMTYGGLRFVDIRLKNKALLNKWIRRYRVELGALRRAIIEGKYKGKKRFIALFRESHEIFKLMEEHHKAFIFP